MPKKAKRSGQHAAKYAAQKTRTSRNKERAWERHLEKYPNDQYAKEQIKKLRGF